MKNKVDKYTYRVEWSKEDNSHIARCLEFSSLSADGPSPEEALKEIKIVVSEAIKWMKQEGEEIPVPFGEKSFSGKCNLRMPIDIHRQASLRAAEQGVSLNQYLLSKISS